MTTRWHATSSGSGGKLSTATQRGELASFLRTRRDRLSPAEVGLPVFGRRRAPGLRREEIAQLAAISTTWYTWLEQAREIRVSESVAASLARALRLDEPETRHLYSLLGYFLPERELAEAPELVDIIERVVSLLPASPAYVVNPRWDIVTWNDSARVLFGIDRAPADKRNLLRFLFPDLALNWTKTRMADPENMVPALIAQFRFDVVEFLDNPEFADLLHQMSIEKDWFRDLWLRHDVRDLPHATMVYENPAVGRMEFEFVALELVGRPKVRLHLYIAKDETVSAKLQRLGASLGE